MPRKQKGVLTPKVSWPDLRGPQDRWTMAEMRAVAINPVVTGIRLRVPRANAGFKRPDQHDWNRAAIPRRIAAKRLRRYTAAILTARDQCSPQRHLLESHLSLGYHGTAVAARNRSARYTTEECQPSHRESTA